MTRDWIDDIKEERSRGINRPLLTGQHEAVNHRYLGLTVETCCECGKATGRAGTADDSLFCGQCDGGPFCLDCWYEHPCEHKD
jgi:hypothetical protein